jgi:Zn-dependent M28 family amino/carboxypeptidase
MKHLRPASSKPWLVLAVLGALGASWSRAASTSPLQTPAAAAQPAEDVRRLASDVAWLADDAREGRRAGTASAREVADWIAARLASLGLEPAGELAGDKPTWLQEFSVPLPARDGGGSRLELFGHARLQMTTPDKLAPLFCSGAGEVRGKPVFRGYGIVNAERGWDDYGGVRLEGAVVVVLRGTPKLAEAAPAPADPKAPVQSGAGWGSSGSLFDKVMTAKRFGAAAVLVVQSLEDLKEAPMRFDSSQTALAGIPALAVSGGVFRDLFRVADVADLRARLDRREPPEPLVAQGMREARVIADVQREKGPAFNVLGRIRGASPERTVVIGAHYDHLGRGGEGSLASDASGATGEIHNGADDNASGTAAALEMARVLAQGPPPAGDVLVALWSGEELGLLGSEHWMQHPTLPLERVRANLNLDMVGRARSELAAANGSQPGFKVSVLGAGTAAAFAGWMDEAGRNAGLALQVSASGQGVGGSDHMSFLKRKIPALHLFTGVHADYHKPSDDSDKIDAEGMARIVRLGLELVRRTQAESALPWVEPAAPDPKDPHAAAATSGFRVWFGSVPEYSYEGPGVLLSGTSAGSPAEKAGLLKGDVLRQVGEVPIETIHDFVYALGLYKPGDVVLARYLRDGKEESVRITLATRAKE